MMIDVFTEEDSELIPAFLKLLPLEVFRTYWLNNDLYNYIYIFNCFLAKDLI